MPDAGRTRSPFVSALLAYFLAMTAVITFAPFRFHVPDRFPVSLALSPADVAGNVCLFLPIGFLYRAIRGGSVASVSSLGFLLSLLIETLQIASRGRFFSPVDLLTNTAGAAAGAVLHRAVQRRLEVRLAGQLALELPLMGLVYLLVPLLWLDGLAAGRSPGRLLLAAILGLTGAMVLVAVWVHRLRPSGVLGAGRLAVAAGAWFLVAGLPGLLRRPEFLLAGVMGVGLAAWGLAGSAATPSPERRFEVPTLRRVVPVFAVYLVLMATWPWGAWGSPRLGVGFLDLRDEPGPLPLLQLVEAIAAFTVLGYLLAEYRSRREESLDRAAAAASLGALATAAVLELARAFHPMHGASLLRAVLLTVAGGAGGAVYVQLRDNVLHRIPRRREASA